MTKQEKINKVLEKASKPYNTYKEYLRGIFESDSKGSSFEDVQEHNQTAITYEYKHYCKWVEGSKDKVGQVEGYNFYNPQEATTNGVTTVYTENGPITKLDSKYKTIYSGNFVTEDGKVFYASSVEIPTKENPILPTLKHEGYIDEEGNVLTEFTPVTSDKAKFVEEQFANAYEKAEAYYIEHSEKIPNFSVSSGLGSYSSSVNDYEE